MTLKNAFNSIPYSTTRDDRNSPNLDPKIIGIDQRRLEELIEEMRNIAAEVIFLETSDGEKRSWQQFLDEDVLFFLIQVQQFTISQNQEEIESLEFLISTINQWYKKALVLDIEPLAFEIENAIAHQLKYLSFTTIKGLHHIWKNEVGVKENKEVPTVEKSREITIAFISYIQRICKTLFETYANKKEISQPHIALILSFLKLYKYVQQNFNKLTKKHLDYYFKTLLGQSQKKSEPERTPVFFQLAQAATAITLPEKTKLLAGLEVNGEEILFETTEALPISKAVLTDLNTIYIAENKYIAPHNKFGLITGIYQDSIKGALRLQPNNPPLALVGMDGFGTRVSKTNKHSQIGWGLSAPIFMLKDGVRKVTLSFHIEKDSIHDFKKKLKQMVTLTGIKEKVWGYRFFNKTFKLSLTTNEGWFFIAQFLTTIEEKEKDYELKFSFVLSLEDPKVIPYDKLLHGGKFNSKWPVVKIVLDDRNTYYPYSFLRDARITHIHTKVEVQELDQIEVYDAFGKHDTSTPFPIFGVQPGKAASCYLGYDEWRYKKLTTLDINIKWHQITNVKLKSLYQQYPGKIAANSFKVGFSTLSNRKWKNTGNNSSPLFHIQNDTIESETKIYIDEPEHLKAVPDLNIEKPPVLEEAKNGFFRLQVVTPYFGFGHGIYESIVAKKVAEITKNPKKARKKNIQIPPTPFVPEAEEVTVNYTAEQEFVFHSEEGKRTDKRYPFEVFHIHPFGLKSIANQNFIKERSLLPFFEDKGYLHIGLQKVKPNEQLSLYFKIETPKDQNLTLEYSDLQWEYLEGETWKPVSSTFLLYDGTDRFQHSGILRIQMPKHLEHHHPLFDGNTSWLRLSVPNAVSTQLGQVVCVQLNGVEAIRKTSENHSEFSVIDTTKSIETIYRPIPEIVSLTQPFVPTGGAIIEKEDDFYTRISEQLFHKKRGVLPSDFEKLILEAFPQVYQASCFPTTLFPEEVPRGTIRIMVLPFIYEDTPITDRKFNAYNLLQIEKYLKSICMHHKVLKVTNPFYETVQVSCSVTFNEGFDTGSALQKLNKSINHFIAPWILSKEKQTLQSDALHQILHPSSLLSYLIALPEVKHVGRLAMVQIHRFEEADSYIYKESTGTIHKTGLSLSQPWSVFVPSNTHAIDVVTTPDNSNPSPLQIGTMEIEQDFILKKTDKNESNP